MQKCRTPLLYFFLSVEFVLYVLILTAGGDLLRWSSYISIVLCFLFALANSRKDNRLLVAGLFFTVLADFFLVVCNPIEQLIGMVFFVFTQLCYCFYLHRNVSRKVSIVIRLVLSVIAEVICFAVLKDNVDALACVSVFYYVFLIMNIVDAFPFRKEKPLLPWAFLLFILCDTVIGLQVMSSGYLPITEGSLLYNILYCDFNLAWFFYLPSQVLIALSSRTK